MAIFRIQWLLPTQLVLYLAAVAAAFIANVKLGVILMDLVRCTEFPLVKLSLCAAWVTPSGVLRASIHVLGTSMKVELVQARKCP